MDRETDDARHLSGLPTDLAYVNQAKALATIEAYGMVTTNKIHANRMVRQLKDPASYLKR
jgi:hypothetical protein